jgi:hypothetical protein
LNAEQLNYDAAIEPWGGALTVARPTMRLNTLQRHQGDRDKYQTKSTPAGHDQSVHDQSVHDQSASAGLLG